MLAKRASACGNSHPECNGVSSVRRNRCDSGKEQSWKRNKASASSDGIKRATQRSRYKKEDGNVNRQVLGFTMSTGALRVGMFGEGRPTDEEVTTDVPEPLSPSSRKPELRLNRGDGLRSAPGFET